MYTKIPVSCKASHDLQVHNIIFPKKAIIMGSFSLAATDDVSIASGYFCLAANSLHAYFCTSSYSS